MEAMRLDAGAAVATIARQKRGMKMSASAAMASAEDTGAFAPLREPVFRRIWTASLFSNFGQLFLGVGAAWEMARLSNNNPSMVALVQTALMVPLMFVTLPAGAVADMFDRRKIAISGLAFSSVSAAILATIAFLGFIAPWVLLLFCVLIGGGVAFYSPSWQASIPEQVSREKLPAAIGLGSISYNVARSFGPALGGIIVLAAGAKAVFGLTSLLYLPLLVCFVLWKRRHVPSRLPPERIDRAIIGGARYAFHSPSIRTALIRSFAFGLTTATAAGLAPLVVKELLHGTAATYGIMLGAQGVGAVIGAVFTSQVRAKLGSENAIRLFAIGTGAALATVGVSTSLVIDCLAFFVIGACNILTVAMINVSVQLGAPRWVTARALSLYQSFLTAGVGIGAWAWGSFAGSFGLGTTFIVSGVTVAATAALGVLFPLPRDHGGMDLVDLSAQEPEVAMALTHRSGPIIIEVEYTVDPEQARDFYGAMMKMQSMRKRIGAFEWSISRDIADPAIWVERYHCPTWGDYLRMRGRYTQADWEVQALTDTFHTTGPGRRISRRLERPFGSVRWKAESPDLYEGTMGYIGP
jgi:predicted MFS family arabinose efflux permease